MAKTLETAPRKTRLATLISILVAGAEVGVRSRYVHKRNNCSWIRDAELVPS